MAHDLTESATYTAAVSVPDPGDDRKAASVVVPFQAVTNRTKWLRDILKGAITEALTFLGTVTFSGILNAANDAIFSQDVQIDGLLDGEYAYFNFDAQINRDLAVTRNATIGNNATVGAALTTQTFQCNALANMAADATVGATLTTGGHIYTNAGLSSKTEIGADSDSTYIPANTACVIATTLTGTRTYDVDPGVPGNEIEIVNRSTSQLLNVRVRNGAPPGAPVTIAAGLINTSGSVFSIRLRKALDFSWYVVGVSKAP